jgi:hypothetical protein
LRLLFAFDKGLPSLCGDKNVIFFAVVKGCFYRGFRKNVRSGVVFLW